jgi:hypothetical protein
VSLLVAGRGAIAEGRSTDQLGSLTLLLENDAFASMDRHYTNGLQLSYLTPPQSRASMVSRILELLPWNADGDVRIGWQLGQSIFTPDDKDSSARLPDQRPYAAWLYGGISIVYSTAEHIDTWGLVFGTVGPDARGEVVQNAVHEWLNNDEAAGWHNQIPNQKGGAFIVERKWRALAQNEVSRFGIDLMPHVGMSLGNIETYANAGVSFRVGNDLDNDFGPPRIRPSLPGSAFFVPHDNWAWYLSIGVDGRYVRRNVFLDDHDLESLWSIEKKRWVSDTQAGLVLMRRNFRFAYTYVLRTQEFKQQQRPDRFGSLDLTWRF